MSVLIKLAESPEEKDLCFRLRHRILVEEKGIAPPSPDGRLVDRFDAFDTSVTFIALSNGVPVGTLRLTRDSSQGLPTDALFSFRHLLPGKPLTLVGASHLCLDTRRGENPRVIHNLMMMAFYWAKTSGATHTVFPCGGDLQPQVTEIGFQPLPEAALTAPPAREEPSPTLRILDMSQVVDRFLEFVEGERIVQFVENFNRAFYQPGEPIIRAGDKGDLAYFLVNGAARVTRGDPVQPEGQRRLGMLGPGELFGEIALFTDAPRTANVIAEEETEVMVLSRQAFMNHIRRNPQDAEEILTLLGGRLRDLLQRL